LTVNGSKEGDKSREEFRRDGEKVVFIKTPKLRRGQPLQEVKVCKERDRG